MNPPVSLEQFIQRFDAPSAQAIVLMGSYARGEAGTFSDINGVRFSDGTELPDAGSYLVDGYLVVVSDVALGQVERWFTEPEAATDSIMGVSSSQVLLDRDGYFADIQSRARAFVWDQAMQERTNQCASAMLVGWIEEVHKGLAGLQTNDIGRLLNARHGLSWGLGRVMKVQRGVLMSGDNALYDALNRTMGQRSEWMQLLRTAFGIESEEEKAPTLGEQVRAGFGLYILTAELLVPVLRTEDQELITQTIQLIRETLDT